MALRMASSQGIFADPADALPADVAIRVQLSRTDQNKAVSRHGTINDWIEREGSVLKDRVEVVYPKGSMAIGATICSGCACYQFSGAPIGDSGPAARRWMHPDAAAAGSSAGVAFESAQFA